MTADLITRLESADGPDRELDADISRSIGWGCVVRDPEAQNKYVCWRKHYRSGEWIMLPRYTANIDAALTLVPEGCLSMVRTVWADAHAPTERPVGYASVDRYFKDDAGLFWKENFLALGETPALALAAAALKARGV